MTDFDAKTVASNHSVLDKLLNRHAEAGVERIRCERDRVNTLLARPDAPKVYGFNSLLGHMDHLGLQPGDEQKLLHAHLIGTVVDMPADWLRLLAMTKRAQAVNGGSGISPEALAVLNNVLQDTASGGDDDAVDNENKKTVVLGNWFGSYGSGDVVPGAWFVEAVNDYTQQEVLSQQGDLIALISGNFVSTAAAIVGLERLKTHAYLLTKVFGAVNAYVVGRSEIQESVTVRDLDVVRSQLVDAIKLLENEIVNALSKSSANPMFTFVGNDEVVVSSNSSFLGFSLRMALVRALHTVSVAHAYLLGCTRTIANSQPEGASLAVQPPKVMSANGKRIESIVGSVGGDYTLVESGGVEDVGDLSLRGACDLVRALSTLDDSIAIFHQMVAVIPEFKLGAVFVDSDDNEDIPFSSSDGHALGIDFSALSAAIVRNAG